MLYTSQVKWTEPDYFSDPVPTTPLAGRYLEAEFKKADWDQDGKISLQDFISYYEKIAYLQTQMAREGRIKSASHKHTIPVGRCKIVCLCIRDSPCQYMVCLGMS